jgi:hypothetical protein
MNTKFEWFGFSVARKHVYFYGMLLAVTFAANAMKERVVAGSSEIDPSVAELSNITEQVASLRATSPEP